MQYFSIIGATGSVGSQFLEMVDQSSIDFKPYLLIANSRVDLMLELCKKYQPQKVFLYHPDKNQELKDAITALKLATEVLTQDNYLEHLLKKEVKYIIASALNTYTLEQIVLSIEHQKTILFANKELLVVAGKLITSLVQKHNARLLPLDSEHVAIYNALPKSIKQKNLPWLNFDEKTNVEKIILTASGGPFLFHSKEELKHISVEQALKHPNWEMGYKISIDSASMMNKCLELIEAHWLFHLPENQIDIVIHPQSLVHGMVKYKDGNYLMQMSKPNMMVAMASLLSNEYPFEFNDEQTQKFDFDFNAQSQWDFYPLDYQRYPMVKLVRDLLNEQNDATIYLNNANEIAVEAFVQGSIKFSQIYNCIEQTIQIADFQKAPDSLEEVLNRNNQANAVAQNALKQIICQ